MAVLSNHYEILGVARNANPAEIRHAYNRWVGEFKKETTPPDPRREALLQEAYEVLSDPQRRDAYDAELAQSQPPGRKAALPVAAIAGAVAVVLAAGGAYFAFRPGAGGSTPKAKSEEQIQLAISGSVSRLMVYDISGKAAPAGMGFVIEDKVMVANCVALPPGSQLMVQTGTRQVSARITAADPALGLCKLHTDGYVGEPLAVSSAGPAAGSKVYSGSYGAKGDVTLQETAVAKVVDEPQGKAVQAAGAAQAGTHGAPLLDAQGKVVAVATLQPDGTMLHRVVPAQWLAENRPRVEEPRPYQGGGAAGAAASAGSPGSRATAASGSSASTGGTYAPPLENTDYGCDCDFTTDKDFVAEREEKWKKISELPPAERERAAKAQRMAEEYTRKTMKDTNERLRRSGVE